MSSPSVSAAAACAAAVFTANAATRFFFPASACWSADAPPAPVAAVAPVGAVCVATLAAPPAPTTKALLAGPPAPLAVEPRLLPLAGVAAAEPGSLLLRRLPGREKVVQSPSGSVMPAVFKRAICDGSEKMSIVFTSSGVPEPAPTNGAVGEAVEGRRGALCVSAVSLHVRVYGGPTWSTENVFNVPQ